ncbi:Nuclear pore complex protein Nup98-Nup96 [Babesia sp. Xinjiang]|uniref:Nuclear pore complex protein Nup98-Nup96 n=1 Tax=Babesia sp. Xinjiang TaxID=462227 RepID=UPI000A21BF2B|nr:Nuclear pore complex protein Nup98-Nup96 [Babesia sp. Xinjiang]ORM39919.1 Nuclear pore complex protein Nup98-Nup96 [Babesia sp. Xinjiang]
MFGNTNRGTNYWASSTQPSSNMPGSFNTLGSSVTGGQATGSTFGGFGGANTMGNTGFMSQTPTTTFGVSQNTSLFGQQAQQNTATGFGGMNTTGGMFDQNKQGFMGSSTGLFGQNNQSNTMFGSGMNTGASNTFNSGMNTGSTLFGSNTNTGGLWSSGTNTGFGTQIQGSEVATPKHFDGASITHIAYEKPDTCKDEYRWEYYKKVTPQGAASAMQPATSATGGLFGSTQPTTTTGGLFGSTQAATPTGGLFGSTQPATSTGGPFGSTQPATTGGLFGSSTTGTTGGGLFGSTQPTTGTSTGGLFGATTQSATPTGGLFGSTQTGGLFGATQPATTGGLFGSTTTGTTGGGLFGTTQPATGTTGILGTTQPSTSTTGLFGSTNTAGATGTTGLFGSSSTSTFGGTNKSLFGNLSTGSTTTGTTTTGTGLFGTSNMYGSSSTMGTGASTGTTSLFRPATTGTTGTGLFGSGSTTTTSTVPNLFGTTSTTSATATTPSLGLFGSTTGTGTGNLFGTTTTPATSGSLLSFGTGGTQTFGSTTSGAQLPQTCNMRLGPLTLSWNVNTPSPGVQSFWSNESALPQEAKQYLVKLSNSQNNAAQGQTTADVRQAGTSVASGSSDPGIGGLEDTQDRFGLRQVLKDLGVQIPRYKLHPDIKDEYMVSCDVDSEVRVKTSLSAELKVQRDLCGNYAKVPKLYHSDNLHTSTPESSAVSDDTFLSLHNGGAKEFEALRHEARGCNLRKPQDPSNSQTDDLPYLPSNRSSLLFEKPSNTSSIQGNLLTVHDDPQASSSLHCRAFDEVYKSESGSGEASQMASRPSYDAGTTEDSVCLDNPAPSESVSLCPIFKLADDTPGHPPILTKEGYTTRPTMSSLRQMSDKQLSNVMDFQVIRQGFGDILWPGYTDVRHLNLDKIVDIAHRKVTLYGSTSRVHPVGEGLNKNAIITLYNCAPAGYVDGKSITETVDQLEKLKDHTTSLGCKFLSANFKTGQWVFEAPCFVKNTSGDVSERKSLSFTT